VKPVAFLILSLLPAAGAAHEVLHQIGRGRAVDVTAFESDGEVLSDRPFEVFAPTDGAKPWQSGRTDRAGRLAFVPSGPGAWRVRVVDDSGHGLDVVVDVDASGAVSPEPHAHEALHTLSFVLRPLLGAAVIAGIFFGLHRLRRRRAGRT